VIQVFSELQTILIVAERLCPVALPVVRITNADKSGCKARAVANSLSEGLYNLANRQGLTVSAALLEATDLDDQCLIQFGRNQLLVRINKSLALLLTGGGCNGSGELPDSRRSVIELGGHYCAQGANYQQQASKVCRVITPEWRRHFQTSSFLLLSH